MRNVAEALLLFGILYLDAVYHYSAWYTVFLAILAILTWGYAGFNDEREELWKARIRLTNAKAEYFEESKRQLKYSAGVPYEREP